MKEFKLTYSCLTDRGPSARVHRMSSRRQKKRGGVYEHVMQQAVRDLEADLSMGLFTDMLRVTKIAALGIPRELLL